MKRSRLDCRVQHPDPVGEGQTPLPLGSACGRKRLRSSGGGEDEARRSCARRPNPEGSLSAGELSSYGKPEEEKQQRLCQRCHIMASQLNRQAAALTDAASMKTLNSDLVAPFHLQNHGCSASEPVLSRPPCLGRHEGNWLVSEFSWFDIAV
ncbi:hypothetical protein CCH79_00018510 [Gambusia affinis]|uniref:Uncharacterized protein n=1 Tax=Gambusia affinis TaxID=33528 RepID=A0A315URW9_GAMAF|nr:hypothetical protein CCH79_00018510 [Gambusia affinis]